jgi:phosphoribosyl-ATP pyrophosphohydrolase/phosphoribosyl-AMP cyclohydrolase
MAADEQIKVKLNDRGLVPGICQDTDTGQVLMTAFMNPASIKATLDRKEMVFYSRSREELWHKGATSGNYMHVESAHVDCDGDALLFKVKPDGPACHTGETSCFFTPLTQEPAYEEAVSSAGVLQEVFQVIKQRQQEMPEGSYTTSLFQSGRARIAQKVVEEGGEVALAGATGDTANLAGEVADLLYHTLVLLADTGVAPDDVWAELRNRQGQTPRASS